MVRHLDGFVHSTRGPGLRTGRHYIGVVTLRIGTSMSDTAGSTRTSLMADAFLYWRATIAVSVAVIAAIVLLAWIGGELHYRNCLAEAELKNPNGFAYAAPDPRTPGAIGYLTPTRLDDRAAAADSCSRVPW